MLPSPRTLDHIMHIMPSIMPPGTLHETRTAEKFLKLGFKLVRCYISLNPCLSFRRAFESTTNWDILWLISVISGDTDVGGWTAQS